MNAPAFVRVSVVTPVPNCKTVFWKNATNRALMTVNAQRGPAPAPLPRASLLR